MEQQALTGSLIAISGGPYQITSYSFTLQRLIGSDGKITEIHSGKILLSVILTPDSKLVELMANKQSSPLEGEIVIKKADAEFQKIDFSEAYITSYSQNIDLTDSIAPTCSIIIEAARIRIGRALIAIK